MKKNNGIITGKHHVLGVIGDPIEHTLSPLIHNALAEAMNKEAIYVPFHVTEQSLEDAIRGAYALNIKGLNVTMPHKQELFKYVAKVDASAQMIGAINTLVYSLEGYIGYNTDYIGLRELLKENHIEWKDQNVAIIGSGGAAYAAYVSVAGEAKGIHIFNRTLANATALKEHMKQYFDTPTFIYAQDEVCEEEIDIVIQTTGIGMGKYIGQIPSCTESVLNKAHAAVDMIYHPKETQFLKAAKAKGCRAANGFSMLFYQAVSAFELMHGISCDKESILNIKRELLEYAEV
ncbi:shikimate dehydrogenase [Cellulosilyticum sp. I15G10I2]|uniref:shikimate dehydrogenase n=1 Tax=Cellulosilyticum sp. I15G10I2 TaxID=1892843 RepID=UPI00085BDFDC|nr:shikimate dehydrogenase [Cellulosilyticum sp. I15G10I2]